ncbi:hypothetical protein DFH06DRAFT_536412 [Mycena polygramma]|nr:hypothetical protein DFH06DRAFT_536412 [Mycena polygramma]
MSEPPPAPAAVVAREARAIHAGLKALLARDVWANYREADFQRKNLRRRYLHLLLLHPTAREARDAGTHLWMQTSYAFIALYKQKLARSSSASASHPSHHHNHSNNNNTNSNNNTNGGGGAVETRKLLQRFRQFLADEERFWRALVLRVQRAYAVALAASLPPDSLPAELVGVGGAGGADADDGGVGGGGGGAGPGGGAGAGGAEERMNHFGFPPASSANNGDAGAGGQGLEIDEATARSILSKVLVCLGDIARYREQYKIPPPKKPFAGGNTIHIEARPNYTRARALYLAAHALAPAEGNAAHQVGILGGYESDTLASLAWYLRALCVRAPFDTAGENLGGVLARVVAGWRAGASSLSSSNSAAMNGGKGGGGGNGNGKGVGGGGGGGGKDASKGKELHIDLEALATRWHARKADVNGNAGTKANAGQNTEEGGENANADKATGDGETKREKGEKDEEEREDEEDEKAEPRVRVERFKRALVLLHAVWRDGRWVFFFSRLLALALGFGS